MTGKGHCIDFPRNAMRICIPFSCTWGSLDLEVALIEEIAPRQQAARPAMGGPAWYKTPP